MAKRSGLQSLTDVNFRARGIGDDPAQAAFVYLASQLRVESLTFTDHPLSVFSAARTVNHDGLIGADVFDAFIVRIDFPRGELILEPRAGGLPDESGEPVNAGTPPPGFHRVVRFGHFLTVPTSIDGAPISLFGIDSGASTTVVDTDIASMSASVHRDGNIKVEGIQGNVKDTSRTERVVLQFAGFRQENASLIAVSISSISDALGVGIGGVLGMPILGQLNLTLDYREGNVRFEYKK